MEKRTGLRTPNGRTEGADMAVIQVVWVAAVKRTSVFVITKVFLRKGVYSLQKTKTGSRLLAMLLVLIISFGLLFTPVMASEEIDTNHHGLEESDGLEENDLEEHPDTEDKQTLAEPGNVTLSYEQAELGNGSIDSESLYIAEPHELPAASSDGDITVFVSFEGYNLGHGFYIEPTAVTVPGNSNALDATRKLIVDSGHTYELTPWGPRSPQNSPTTSR